MLVMMDSFTAQGGDFAPPEATTRAIEWRGQYDGLVSVAYIGGKAVAGISGPWSGKFALTWWDRPLPARQLELFDSMEQAQGEVEQWAMRMHTGGYSVPLVHPTPQAAARAKAARAQVDSERAERPAGLFDRVLTLIPQFSRKPHGSPSETIERLRRVQVCRDTDLSGLHFAANE